MPRYSKCFGAISLDRGAAKGRPLTAIERKHVVKYDPKRAPPKAVGALNMPKAMAPPAAPGRERQHSVKSFARGQRRVHHATHFVPISRAVHAELAAIHDERSEPASLKKELTKAPLLLCRSVTRWRRAAGQPIRNVAETRSLPWTLARHRCAKAAAIGPLRRRAAAPAAAPAGEAPCRRAERPPSVGRIRHKAARLCGEAAVGDFVTATVKGEERTAEVARRDSTGRVRLSLAGGDSIWVQMDAILSVLPPEEAAAAKEAAKAAQKAKVEAAAYNLATAGRHGDEGLKKRDLDALCVCAMP